MRASTGVGNHNKPVMIMECWGRDLDKDMGHIDCQSAPDLQQSAHKFGCGCTSKLGTLTWYV